MHFSAMSLFASLLRTQAYLDPGSGSFLIQLLIAGVVGATDPAVICDWELLSVILVDSYSPTMECYIAK
jgi:hypothetical protein